MKNKEKLIVAVALLLNACVVSEIGNPKNSAGGSDLGDGCVTESERPIGWTEKSKTGVSPADVFGEVAGTCQAPFQWDGTGWGDTLVVNPVSGESTIEVTIEIDEASAVFIKSKPEESNSGIKPPCPDSFEASARVSLATEDGAFKENKTVTITYSDGDRMPRIDFSVSAENLSGTLAIEPSDNWEVSLNTQIMPIQRECAGSIGLSANRRIDKKTGEGVAQGDFASWSTSNCEFGTRSVDLAERYQGISLVDEIEKLWGDSVYQGVWDDDGTTEFVLEVDTSAETGCVENMGIYAVVSVPVTVESHTSDGRISRMNGNGSVRATIQDNNSLSQLDLWMSEDIKCGSSFDFSYASIDCSKVDHVTAQLGINHYYQNNGQNGGSAELYTYYLSEGKDDFGNSGAADSVPTLRLSL
jgi:hypothetical protein